MAVQKIDYSLSPPWTYDDLVQKYYEILGTLGVYGSLVDTFPSPYQSQYNIFVYKRTYTPSESPAPKYPHMYSASWIQDGSHYRLNWFTNDGSWNTETHRFVPGTNEAAYRNYYNTGSSTHYQNNYRALCWNAPCNLNEQLPIYLYRSTEDPNFWWIAIDNGSEGVAYHESNSAEQLDPMVAIDQLYCFPTTRLHGLSRSIEMSQNFMSFADSWALRGSSNTSYTLFGSSTYQRYGDLDEHGFALIKGSDTPSSNSYFSMPSISPPGGNTSVTDQKLTLVRGAKYTTWMKNKIIPSDFALLGDYGITSQTRVGQPYIINGKTYEVVMASASTSLGMFLVAQITD